VQKDPCQTLQPGGDIDRIADHHVFKSVGTAETTGHHGTGVDTYPHCRRRSVLLEPAAVEIPENCIHRERAANGVNRMLVNLLFIFAGYRDAKNGNYGIAGVLFDDTSVDTYLPLPSAPCTR
jgi:hypothetical protein